MEGKLKKDVNKTLYKFLLLILKIIPFLLAINETLFTILNYYEVECYSLNFFGGFSVLFILQLYIMSYLFHYCSWHRVPLHYVVLVNIIALYDTFVKIPLSDLQMLRMYMSLAGISLILIVYLKFKRKC